MKNLLITVLVSFLFITPGQGESRSSISVYGITWTFDKQYECGQFVNGDWWVLAPAIIQSVSPAPSGGRHGSMVNPTYGDQAFDSRVTRYNASLGVTYPKTLQANQSLVSFVSITTSGTHQSIVGENCAEGHAYGKRAAVLTCLGSAPAATAFRPPWAGTAKPLYHSKDLKRDLLPKLAPVTGTPAATQYAGYFRNPWIHNGYDWQGRMLHPIENMPNYYGQVQVAVANAVCLLILDVPNKDQLLINFVQLGIDHSYATKLGMGDRTAIETPILFAGILLGESSMLNLSGSVFRMTNQTYYYNDPSLPTTDPSGNPLRGQKRWATNDTVMWRQKKLANGTGEYEHVNPADWTNFTKYPHFANYSATIGANKLEDYRNCCGTGRWPGIALGVMFLPGGREAWGHSAFFDYVDRVHKVPIDVGWQPFIGNMWNTYRSQVTGIDRNNSLMLPVENKCIVQVHNDVIEYGKNAAVINVRLPQAQPVRVAINAINGKEVTCLLNEKATAGAYSVSWEGSQALRSGVYYLVVTAEGNRHYHPLTLLR
jgi:hypothetical protein